DAHIAHNTYLQVAAEGGLTTLAPFLALMALALSNCRTARRIADERNEPKIADLAGAVRISILTFAVAAFFLTANYLVFYWFLIFVSENLREIAVAGLTASRQGPAIQVARQAHS
ncbi:MAG TPA: hypothetical protein VIX59_03510, partial [Candidatus Binataceae bacterium]